MKYSVILFCLIFCIDFPAASQNVAIRSRIDSLNDVSFRNRKSNPAMAIKLAKESLQKGTEASYKKGIVDAKLNIAAYYIGNKQHYDSALYLLLEIDDELNDEIKKAIACFYLGRVYLALQNYERAKHYFESADKVFLARAVPLLNDDATKDFVGAVPNALGALEMQQANYNPALEYFQMALQSRLRYGTPPNLEFHNIANVYARMGEYQKSRDFARKSLVVSEEIKDTLSLIATINLIGISFNRENNLDSAYYYFNEAQLLAEENSNIDGLSNSLLNKSGVMKKKGQNKMAVKLLRQNLRIVSKFNPGNKSSAYLDLARIYKESNHYDSAIICAQLSYSIATEMNHTVLKRDNVKLLSDIFRATKQYDSAFKYSDLYLLHQSEFEKANKESQFSNLRVQLETIEKDQQINELKAQTEIATLRNGRLILAITCILLLGIIIIGVIIHKNKLKEKKHAMEQLKLRLDLDTNKDILYKQTLYMININNCLDEIQEYTNELMRAQFDPKLGRILSLIKTNRTLENEWNNFNYYFTSVHSGFYEKLEEFGAELTMHEKRVCALVKLNLSNREIATLLNIEPKSVTMLKYRIKKKLAIGDLVELESSLQTI